MGAKNAQKIQNLSIISKFQIFHFLSLKIIKKSTRLEEEARLAEEARIAEEARLAEENRLAEEEAAR